MRCPSCYRRLVVAGACPLHPGPPSFAESSSQAEKSPVLPGYSPLIRLSRGGFGSVYEATRQGDRASCVVKIALVPFDPQFALEAEVLRRLGPPISPRLHAHGQLPDGRPYLVMERLSGEPLATWLAHLPGDGIPKFDVACSVLRGLCITVDLLHEEGVIHRDLKPENVFLRTDGSIGLLDFGLALFQDERQLAAHVRADRPGTVEYMAPEQCTAQGDLTRSADLYALGAMAFELLTGRPPFVGEPVEIERGHASLRPPRPSAVAASSGKRLAPAVDDVILRCLAKRPEDRFAHATDLFIALEAAGRAEASERAPVRLGRRRTARSRSGPIALMAIRTSAPASEVARFAGEGSLVLRTDSTGVVLGFPGEASPREGLGAALEIAARLPAWAEQVVLHCAEARIRDGSRRMTLSSDAVGNAESWRPAPTESSERVLLTEHAASLLGSTSTAPSAAVGFRTPALQASATASEGISLHGREELLETLVQEVQASLDEEIPRLCTVVGDVGFGKSRLLQELLLRLDAQKTRVALLKACGSSKSVLFQLLETALSIDSATCTIAQIRAACAERVGSDVAEQAWPAVARVLGLLPDDHTLVRALAAAPGALRHLVALAAGRGLCAIAGQAPLALLVDDAHAADPTTLDALELATTSAGSFRLFICVTTSPALSAQRSAWADRARRSSRHSLEPLDEQTSRSMLAELLKPVEYVTAKVMGRLLEQTRGVPLYMVEVVNSLRAAGAIRQQPGTTSWQLAADEVLSGSRTAIADQLAGRALGALPEDLLRLAHLCAIVGDTLEVAELEALATFLDEQQGGLNLDASVGMARLSRAGLLRHNSPSTYDFRHPMFREAVERLIPAPSRAALHQGVLEWLQRKGLGSAQTRLAHHAAACGARRTASAAYLALGETARQQHRYEDAEQNYTLALGQLDGAQTRERAEVLRGRGSVRYRVNRLKEALEDLRGARSVAEQEGDVHLTLELMLEEATVLDWLEDWAGSQDLTELSAPLAASAGDKRLDAALLMARGRALYRRESFEAAIPLLDEAASIAASVGEHETRVIALLCLSTSLTLTHRGRLAEAAKRFSEVISVCQETGDRLHLGTAFSNRILLWQRLTPERAEEDIHRALAIAREIGHAQLERICQFNLAELQHWRGAEEEALRGARRSREIQLRYFREPSPDDSLLIARILLWLEGAREAEELLSWVKANCPEKTFLPTTRLLLKMVELRIHPGQPAELGESCSRLFQEAIECQVAADYRMEIYCNAIAASDGAAAWGLVERFLGEARAVAGTAAQWSPRLDSLELQLQERRKSANLV